MNIGELFVRLTADPTGVTRGVDAAAQKLNGFEGVVKRVGVALGGMFAAHQVGRFMADSVRTFTEAEDIWERLGATVRGTGQSFSAVQPQIVAAAAEMQALTRFGDEEFAEALQNITLQTRDVGRALGAMGLAADLAAARQISLKDASELLARGMAGNTMQLERMFPALRGSTDLMGDLQEMVKGMAEQDANTLNGRLGQLNNAWGDFKEAVGGALVGGNDMRDLVRTLTGVVQRATKYIEANARQIEGVGKAMGFAFTQSGNIIDGFLRFVEALQSAYEWLARVNGAIDRFFGRDTSYLNRFNEGLRQQNAGLLAIVGGAHRAGAAITTGLTNPLDKAAEAAERLKSAMAELDRRTGFQGRADTLQAPALAQPTTRMGEQSGILERMRATLDRLNTTLSNKAPALAPGPRGNFAREFAGGITSGISGLANAFGPLAAAAMVLAPIFQGFRSALAPIENLLQTVGQLLGTLLLPVLQVITVPLRLFGLALSYVTQAMGWLVRGIGKLIDKIPGVSGGAIIRAGQEMIESSKKARDALAGAADEVNRFTSSMSNVPEIFDLLLRRRQAATGGGTLPGTGGTGGGAGGGTGGGGAAVVVNINNPPAGLDVETVVRQVTAGIVAATRRGGATELGLALAGGR